MDASVAGGLTLGARSSIEPSETGGRTSTPVQPNRPPIASPSLRTESGGSASSSHPHPHHERVRVVSDVVPMGSQATPAATVPTVARTLYDVLGVVPTAAADEVRRAYLARARESHPDRYVDASPAQRNAAEGRMREVNEAWRVLGNPRRRRRYDLELMPARPHQADVRFASRSDGTMPEVIEYEDVDGTARIIRGLPWMIVVVVLFAIFVFTAYATTGGGTTTPLPANNLGRCVRPAGDSSVEPAACGSPGARLVIATVDPTQQCPVGSERLAPLSGTTVYCLEV
jgi:DnaJ-domain-containing protein 1